jgi:GMP synthase (glutamine-hydrolysing)
MQPSIAVLDASLGDTPARRNIERELDAATTVYKVSEGEFPPAVTDPAWRHDAVVVSGSQTAVYDDRPWIRELTEWFRTAHEAGVPSLGICWGHQFIAQALGGTVEDMGEYELGYRTVEVTDGSDPVFEGLPEAFTAFETHSDRVTELPAGASELARNDYGLQAFRVGPAVGVQFHPEYDRQTAEWVIEGKEDLPADRRAAAEATLTEESVAAAETATRVFDNFLRSVRRVEQ